MDEKQLIILLGLDKAWGICDLVTRTLQGMRAHLPKGNPVSQVELVVKYLAGKGTLDWDLSQKLLKGLDHRTTQAILRIANSKPHLLKAWLL